MNTVKIQVHTNTVVTEVKEITLPYYSKSNCHFYKVFNESQCISVTTLPTHRAIDVVHSELAFNNKECTEIEFQLAFKKVAKYLTKLALEND